MHRTDETSEELGKLRPNNGSDTFVESPYSDH